MVAFHISPNARFCPPLSSRARLQAPLLLKGQQVAHINTLYLRIGLYSATHWTDGKFDMRVLKREVAPQSKTKTLIGQLEAMLLAGLIVQLAPGLWQLVDYATTNKTLAQHLAWLERMGRKPPILPLASSQLAGLKPPKTSSTAREVQKAPRRKEEVEERNVDVAAAPAGDPAPRPRPAPAPAAARQPQGLARGEQPADQQPAPAPERTAGMVAAVLGKVAATDSGAPPAMPAGLEDAFAQGAALAAAGKRLDPEPPPPPAENRTEKLPAGNFLGVSPTKHPSQTIVVDRGPHPSPNPPPADLVTQAAGLATEDQLPAEALQPPLAAEMARCGVPEGDLVEALASCGKASERQTLRYFFGVLRHRALARRPGLATWRLPDARRVLRDAAQGGGP